MPETAQFSATTLDYPEQTFDRRITLNHDAARWMHYGNGIMPVLLQQDESGWHIAAF